MSTDTPHYVALGDSMSLDRYPTLDLEDRGVVPASGERPIGAASLLHRNDDDLWPEFAGRDLAHRLGRVRKLDVCIDGGTIGDVLGRQLERIHPRVRETTILVTVTAGGNDLLGALFERGVDGLIRSTTEGIRRYGRLADAVREAFPGALIVLTTVYDPTDGTGNLPGLSDVLGRLPMEHLDRFNDAVREAAETHRDTVLADVHGHFLGHGVSADEDDRWYWLPNPIEPAARGASEIRRIWLDAVGTLLRE